MRALLIVTALITLTACGQKGPLYLENEQSPDTGTAPVTQTGIDEEALIASKREQDK